MTSATRKSLARTIFLHPVRVHRRQRIGVRHHTCIAEHRSKVCNIGIAEASKRRVANRGGRSSKCARPQMRLREKGRRPRERVTRHHGCVVVVCSNFGDVVESRHATRRLNRSKCMNSIERKIRCLVCVTYRRADKFKQMQETHQKIQTNTTTDTRNGRGLNLKKRSKNEENSRKYCRRTPNARTMRITTRRAQAARAQSR